MAGRRLKRLSEAEEREIAEQERMLDDVFSLLDQTKFRTIDLFETLDTDQSGTIDRRELHNTLAEIGLDVSKNQTAALFSMLDVDQSGDITIAEFLQRMRKLQLERRAAAKAEARRKAIEARKMGTAEAERAAATKARLDGYERLGRVDERPRSAKADAALLRIVQYMGENKLKMADVFNRMDADDSGFIDKDELQTTMCELGLDLSLEEAAQVCSDLDVDGDGTVERAEFFKRYQLIHREHRKATWSQQRRKKDSHSFQTIDHNPNLRLDLQSKRAWQWQPTKFRVPSIDTVANPAPAPVDIEALASAIQTGMASTKWPVQPAPCPAPAKSCLPNPGRPASAPASTRRSQPFSASSRPGSGARKKHTSAGTGETTGTRPQPRPSSGATKLAATITGHLELLKPSPISSSAAANAAAEKAWKQNHVDVLLSILEQHKLKLADLFNQIDADGSGAIDHEELRLLLMLMGVDVSDREKLQVLFSLLDVDGDGEIELHEFLQRMQEIQKDRAITKAGVSRRIPIVKKHPIMQRTGENYRQFQATRDKLQRADTGTVSDRCGSPRPASATARMQSSAPTPRPLSATVKKAREKQRAEQAAAEAATTTAASATAADAAPTTNRPPLADAHPNKPVVLAAVRSSHSRNRQRTGLGKDKGKGNRPPIAPHRHLHTDKLVAVAQSRRAAERKSSAGRIAIFAGVSVQTAEEALQRSKDDVAVATQMVMRDKLARDSGRMLAAPRRIKNGDDEMIGDSTAAGVVQLDLLEESAAIEGPSILWQSTTAQRDKQQHRSAAAVAAAARIAKEQRSGAWVPVGFHVDILEKNSASNDRKQLSR